MEASRLARYAAVCAAFALLAGCGGSTWPALQPSGTAAGVPETGLTALSIARLAARTMPHYVAKPVHPDRGRAWMAHGATKEKKLLYISDWATDDVYVFSYPAGNLKGKLTGFEEPYGQCVDLRGDVWIANFEGSSIVEYAHGGTTPLASLMTAGAAIGCAVSPSGDLAVANFAIDGGAGDIEVFTKGSGNPAQYASSSCYNLWPPGYDNQGNLYVESQTGSTNAVCELPAGGTMLAPISFNRSIGSPGSIMWDGEYLAVTDQDYDATQSTAIYQAAGSVSGSLKLEGTTDLTDTCNGSYADIPQPFIVGGVNTPRNKKEGTVAVGGNLECTKVFDYWAYPWPGGNPLLSISQSQAPKQPYGQSYTTLNKVK